MKRNRKIRWLSLALIACVVLTALPIAGLAGSAPAIALNTDAITKGNTVYFGVMGSDPIQWRVLSGGSDSTLPVSGSGKALLISEKTLAVIQFNPDPDASNANVWAGSNAQNWCTKFYNNWPAAAGSEKDAILETTVAESNDETYTSSTESYNYFYQGGLYNKYYGAAPLDKERFFFLSAKEAETLFDSDGDRIPSGTSKSWWLRSPLASNAGFSGCVVPEGWVNFTRVDFTDGARPAFNLDLSAVLLVSPAEGGKSGGATLAAVGTTDTKDWKLTLKDKDRGFADNGAATPFTAQAGGTVSIPYKNAKTGTNEYVSALLFDGTDAKYYGSVPVAAASGTATFTLPGDLTVGKTYTLKVFNEQKNGDKKSDYASDFVEYKLTVSEAPSPSPSPSPSPAADTTPTPTPTPTPAADTTPTPTPTPGHPTAVLPATQLPYMDDTDPDNGGQNNHSGKQWKFPKTGDSSPPGPLGRHGRLRRAGDRRADLDQ